MFYYHSIQIVDKTNRTGYAALSWNGAKEKLRSEAKCFSLRSDEARAAASGARVVAGGSTSLRVRMTPTASAGVAHFLFNGYRGRQLLSA